MVYLCSNYLPNIGRFTQSYYIIYFFHLLAAAMNLECSLQVMIGSGRFRRNVLIALVRVFVSTSVGSSKLSLSLFFLSKPSVNSRLTLDVTPTTRYNPWSSRPRLSSVLKHLEIMEGLWSKIIYLNLKPYFAISGFFLTDIEKTQGKNNSQN